MKDDLWDAIHFVIGYLDVGSQAQTLAESFIIVKDRVLLESFAVMYPALSKVRK
jgi:hypothetical protein